MKRLPRSADFAQSLRNAVRAWCVRQQDPVMACLAFSLLHLGMHGFVPQRAGRRAPKRTPPCLCAETPGAARPIHPVSRARSLPGFQSEVLQAPTPRRWHVSNEGDSRARLSAALA